MIYRSTYPNPSPHTQSHTHAHTQTQTIKPSTKPHTQTQTIKPSTEPHTHKPSNQLEPTTATTPTTQATDQQTQATDQKPTPPISNPAYLKPTGANQLKKIITGATIGATDDQPNRSTHRSKDLLFQTHHQPIPAHRSKPSSPIHDERWERGRVKLQQWRWVRVNQVRNFKDCEKFWRWESRWRNKEGRERREQK